MNKNMKKVIINILWQKRLMSSQLTIKNCVNEYINKINNSINIYNFPWKKMIYHQYC